MVASWASSVLAYGSYLTYKYLYDGFFIPKQKKIQYFLDHPPPNKKGAGIRMVTIWLHAHVFAYTSSL